MVRVCLWSLAFAAAAVSLWTTPTPAWCQSATAAPGDRVRLQAPDRVIIPDLVTLEGGRVVTHLPFEGKDDLVVVRDGDRTLHVPRPGRRLTGRLVAITDETVTLREGKDRTISVPRQAVERLEVKRSGHPWVGGLVGVAAGFAIGYALGYNSEKDCSGMCMPEAAGLGAGVLLALPAGAVGALLTSGGWQPVPMENVRVAIALRRGGATAGITMRF
jgi:hypothetical protein